MLSILGLPLTLLMSVVAACSPHAERLTRVQITLLSSPVVVTESFGVNTELLVNATQGFVAVVLRTQHRHNAVWAGWGCVHMEQPAVSRPDASFRALWPKN